MLNVDVNSKWSYRTVSPNRKVTLPPTDGGSQEGETKAHSPFLSLHPRGRAGISQGVFPPQFPLVSLANVIGLPDEQT